MKEKVKNKIIFPITNSHEKYRANAGIVWKICTNLNNVFNFMKIFMEIGTETIFRNALFNPP